MQRVQTNVNAGEMNFSGVVDFNVEILCARDACKVKTHTFKKNQ